MSKAFVRIGSSILSGAVVLASFLTVSAQTTVIPSPYSTVISLSAVQSAAPQSICVDLAYDLFAGLSDSGTDHSVMLLQGYLVGAGYLKAAPNGYFGPATLAAVKAFQSSQSISVTGRVGPLTRSAIKQKSCATAPATSVPASVPVASTAPSAPAVPAASSLVTVGITSPAVGQALPAGTSFVVRWNTDPSNDFNLVLEQPGGAGAGFAAQDLSAANGKQYIWKVGKAFSTQSNTNITVPSGTYRLRLQNSSGGAQTGDVTSGWFTIIAAQFGATSVVPSSAPADNATSVVVFGSGLTRSTSVYFDADGSGIRATNAYASSDGTVLVFTVPTAISSGSHTLYIDNGSSPAVTLPFSVTSLL